MGKEVGGSVACDACVRWVGGVGLDGAGMGWGRFGWGVGVLGSQCTRICNYSVFLLYYGYSIVNMVVYGIWVEVCGWSSGVGEPVMRGAWGCGVSAVSESGGVGGSGVCAMVCV